MRRIRGLAIAAVVVLASQVVVAEGPEPSPQASASAETRDAGLRALLDYAPRPRLCRPIGARRLVASVPQAIAGIRCRAPMEFRDRDTSLHIRYYRFPTSVAIDEWWSTVLTTDPGGPWRVVGSHEFPIAPDSGTLEICRSLRYAESWGETGWFDAEGRRGRIACWKGGVQSPRCDDCTRIHPTLHWTVADESIGAMAAGEDAASWRWREHPGWQQAVRTLEPGSTPHPPFTLSSGLRPLPDWVAERLLPGDTLPRSRPSLEVGVVIPLVVGHCDDASQTYDIDGSWWIPVAAADGQGEPIPAERFAVFEEGSRAEFLLIDEGTGQLRLPAGYVFEYERSGGAIKRYGCR